MGLEILLINLSDSEASGSWHIKAFFCLSFTLLYQQRLVFAQ
jgi:hypothetical protein